MLRHDAGGGSTSGMIVETEAYLGDGDYASHARFGPTRRSRVLFGPPGLAYVYLIYGMHYLFNVVTESDGVAGAVLIRALEPLDGADLMAARRGRVELLELTRGPARLCQALAIELEKNEADLTRGPLGIWRGESLPGSMVLETPRIGVAGSKEELYRYLVKGNPYVSG